MDSPSIKAPKDEALGMATVGHYEAPRPGADAVLEQSMGYKAELRRNLSMATILGLSFSIIAAPFGLSISSSFALTNGGAPAYFWGWIFLSVMTVCMAASLGELCSTWPTSGGVYVWAAQSSSKKWRHLVAFTTGWVSIVANVTLTLAIAFGEAQLIMSAVSLFRDNEWAPTPWQTILTFWAVMLLALIVNLFGVRGNYLEHLNTASIYWGAATVIIVLVTLLVKAGETPGATRRSAHDAFLLWQTSSGWGNFSFFVGCLTPAVTLTGYGCVAFLCEEVREPQRAVPRAMMGSVLVACLTGVLYILPIIFTLPLNIDDLLLAPSGPIVALFRIVVGSNGGAFALLFLLIIVGIFASIGSLTVTLRSAWAFSRDGGLPFSSVWAKVEPRLALPVNAALLTTVVTALLGLIFLGSTAAFSAFTGAATICLGVSYAVPITISVLNGRNLVSRADWHYGPLIGYTANIVTIAWIAFSVVLFCFPTTKTTEPASLNYAAVVCCAFTGMAALYYVAGGKKIFTGPPNMTMDDDLVLSSTLSPTTKEDMAAEEPAARAAAATQ